MHLLLLEDDQTIGMGLKYSLELESYHVTYVTTIADAKLALAQQNFDLFLLDILLPDGTGYDLCHFIKTSPHHKDIPLIFLTACDDEVNIVLGLDMGADDYLTKPFRIRELLSRIRSVLRRTQRQVADVQILNINDLVINLATAKVTKHNQEVILTALEYRLLLTFIQHPNQVLSRAQLLEGIWDIAGDFVNDNTLTVYIKRLRDKLETNPQSPTLIVTVRGLGYKMEV